ncbi:hypothetical protein Tco_1581300, partial [Tanacetum coccineum]
MNEEVQLHALVDGKNVLVTKSSVRVGKDFFGRETPLFDEIYIAPSHTNQLEGMATHDEIYIAPSHTKKIFGNMRRVRKGFSRRETPLFQTMMVQDQEEVGEDEAVNEEMDDSLVRAATTASSLESEQDSGGGPRHQETMGDTIAQTRSENVSKLSNDPLLARGNTLRSGKDSLKLHELMALFTTLQQWVLDLETTKTTQATEIASLKRIVNKLERRNKSRTHGLKRLYRVGSSKRVESSEDEDGDEVIVESVDVVNTAEETRSVVEEVTVVTIPVSAATTTTITTAITNVEMTLAQALAGLKSA